MAKLTKDQVKAAKSIVVTYPAWANVRDAVITNDTEENRDALKLWSGFLLRDQEELGVEIVLTDLLKANQAGFLYLALEPNPDGSARYVNVLDEETAEE